MIPSVEIGNRNIGMHESVFIVAEMSANHNQNFDQAVRIVHEAKEAGADAKNVSSIRPGHGLLPKYLNDVLGRRATHDIKKGTPLDWKLIS